MDKQDKMIKINDTYFIDTDPHNFILVEKSVITKEKYDKLQDRIKEKTTIGKETNNIIGYYGNLQHLLEDLLNIKSLKLTKSKEFENYKELINELKVMKEEFTKEVVQLKSILLGKLDK